MQLSKDERATAVGAIQAHFRAERSEELGELAAGLLLGFIEEQLAPLFYNRGVRDATALVQRISGSLVEELQVLEVVAKPSRRPTASRSAG